MTWKSELISSIKSGRDIPSGKYTNKRLTARLNDAGETALLLAAKHGRLDLLQWLIRDIGANSTDSDLYGNTALLIAANKGFFKLVQWLLREGGASITEQDKYGQTALHLADFDDHEQTTQYLYYEIKRKYDKEELTFEALSDDDKKIFRENAEDYDQERIEKIKNYLSVQKERYTEVVNSIGTQQAPDTISLVMSYLTTEDGIDLYLIEEEQHQLLQYSQSIRTLAGLNGKRPGFFQEGGEPPSKRPEIFPPAQTDDSSFSASMNND